MSGACAQLASRAWVGGTREVLLDAAAQRDRDARNCPDDESGNEVHASPEAVAVR